MRALIFDLDGTLADTLDDIHASMGVAMRAARLEAPSRDRVRASVGGGVSLLVERLVDDEARRPTVLAAFREHYGAHLVVRTRLYPGVHDLLARLDGRPMAVASNKPEAMTRHLLDLLDARRFFAVVLGGDSLPVKKPDPQVVRIALERLGAAAEHALVIGDSRYDIEAARGAGVRVCAVTWGFGPRQSLDGADYVVDDCAQLERILT